MEDILDAAGLGYSEGIIHPSVGVGSFCFFWLYLTAEMSVAPDEVSGV